MGVNALVLAGHGPPDALREYTSASNKALIDVNGKPMLQYVVDALTRADRVERVVVVGPRQDLSAAIAGPNLAFVDDAGDIVENIRAGARALGAAAPILIATSDIPLIEPRVIEGFLDLCATLSADLYYPIVERSQGERKYPLVQRTYVTLKEGVFTGGNVFLVSPQIVEPVAPRVRKFIERRKSPLGLSRLLGLGFVLKLLLKQLTIPELEAKISQVWGVRAAAVRCPWPEIGLDVDKPADLQLVRAALR